MAQTTKYALRKLSAGTAGAYTIFSDGMDKLDYYVKTFLRYQVYSGETITHGDPLCIHNGYWRKAQADGVLQPAVAIAISGETWTSGEYCRGQRCGELTYSVWSSLPPSGEIALGYSGGIVPAYQVSGEYLQKLGASIGNNSIIIQL